jgi:hypothetical protein
MNYKKYNQLFIIILIVISVVFIFKSCFLDYKEGLNNPVFIDENDVKIDHDKFKPKNLKTLLDDNVTPAFVPNHENLFKLEVKREKTANIEDNLKEFSTKIEDLKQKIDKKKETIKYLERKQDVVLVQMKKSVDRLY